MRYWITDYKGSALVKLNGKYYWSLDGYYKSFPIPTGRNLVTAEFSPFLAFGESATISAGLPVLAERNPVSPFRDRQEGSPLRTATIRFSH